MTDADWQEGSDLVACARIVERGDPDRFAAAMATPLPARRRLFPLYAFNVEVARAPWVTQEPMIAEMRLQWWRDALGEIAAGGFVRRHEVVTPLALILDAEGARLLDGLVAARRRDIETTPFDDTAAFETYLEETAGRLLLVSARSLGEVEEAPARDAGFAQGLAAYLRAVPALEARGRRPLADGRPDALRALAERGLARLGSARRVRLARSVRPAFAAACLAGPVLRRVAADPGSVAAGALGLSEFQRRARLLATGLTGRF